MSRPSWDQYWLKIAVEMSSRATCVRRKVGCVLVDPEDQTFLSMGYNGSPPGQKHCIDEGVGCLMVDGHCQRTIHAEANAISRAARTGQRVKGATAYVTSSPCFRCMKLLLAAGVKRIVFLELYIDANSFALAKEASTEWVHISSLP